MTDARAARPRLRLRMFGGCEFSSLAGIVRLETAKTAALLAYLALQGSPSTRPRLMALLWGHLPEINAQRNLRHALWNLRHQFDSLGDPPLLLSDRQTVEFNRHADYWLDVEEFERRLQAADDLVRPFAIAPPFRRSQRSEGPRDATPSTCHHALLQEAIDLYRGDLLDGFAVDDAPEFDEWVLTERERLQAMARQALRQLVTYYIACGDYTAGLAYAERLLALDPWMEEAHRQMMRLLALNGQRSAALAQFETCRRILQEELAVEPSPETIALYQWLKQTRVISPEPAGAGLPIPLTSFVGRAREVAQVKQLLAQARLVTLTGTGGCGKTRLAIQVATDIVDAFKDGVGWVDLATLMDASLMPQTVAQVLGIRELPNQPLSETIANHLRPRHLLLVLDNCEHLVTACAQLATTLLRACPNLKMMATSRQALDIHGETTWRVPSLTMPSPRHLPIVQDLAAYESIRLFVERAAAVKTEFALTEENAPFVTLLCWRLDGIPLAIELAAARVKVLPVEQIATRLDDRFNLLTGGSRTALPRHQTLRATMDWSYDLLSGPERVLFRRLAVFVGGWTLDAAERVTGEQDRKEPVAPADDSRRHSLPPADVLDALEHLIDRSLVMVEEQSNQTRYRFLETIRQYAHDKLGESDETARVHNRHLYFFLALADDGEAGLLGAAQTFWLNRLEIEHDNFRAALRWALEAGAAEEGLQLAGALGEFWERHGYLTEGSEWFRRTLARFGDAPAHRRAKALVRAGKLEWTHGMYEHATTLAEEGLRLCRELEDKPGIALSLHTLGGVMHYQGDHVRAIRLLEESLALFRELENRWGTAATLLWLACAQTRRGETERAVLLWEESLALFRQVGDKWGLGFALGGLGDVARLQGNLARALALLEESLILHWEQGNKSSITFVLEALAATADAQRQPERAARLWGAAEALHKSIGTPAPPSYSADYAPQQSTVCAQIGESAFATEWREGRAMSLEQAIEYALRLTQA